MRTHTALTTWFLICLCGPVAAQPARSANQEPISVYSAPTVSEFLAACKTDQGGCVDEVGIALMDKFQFQGDICLPSVKYGDAVPGWLQSHAQTHALATEDGIFLAVKSLYPCGYS